MVKKSFINRVMLLVTLMISGCATPLKPLVNNSQIGKSFETRSFHSGRFAVRYLNEENKVRNIYGHFSFINVVDDVDMVLRSPLGITLATIKVNEKKASLQLPGKPVVTATNADGLMLKTLGFTLPVEDLKYWLNGVSSPGFQAENQTFNNIGQLIKLDQGNWNITFDYRDNQLNQIELNWIDNTDNGMPIKIKLTLDRKKVIN